MESNLSSGSMIPGGGGSGFGGFDLQGSMRLSHVHQQVHHSQPRVGLMSNSLMCDVFPLSMGKGHNHECEQQVGSVAGFDRIERGKNSVSDEDEPSFNEEGMDDVNKGKNLPLWHRVKWTDSMVKLLIMSVSYVGEDASLEGGRRKYTNLQKKGKWKSISKVMAERGFFVSPQQCEDKFNDLNKRYKKLNDILGRGTSCQVVENPSLLDMMDHLSEKMKDEVRKILSSKQLFYEEMCSYHNGNRLHLPHDPALQRSLQLELRSRDDHDTDLKKHSRDDADEEDLDDESDDNHEEEYEENHSAKRIKPGHGFGASGCGSHQFNQDFNKCFQTPSQNVLGDMQITSPKDQKEALLQKQWFKSRLLQLEEQKLRIELEMLELEKQRLKWDRFSKKKDRELEKHKMENDKMKLENERMSLELKKIEMAMKSNQ